ncbi:MAG: hypothetical protein IJ193_01750 [Bacilli bacterium]|nr:hypothetical protein [Bacilli bacterium]
MIINTNVSNKKRHLEEPEKKNNSNKNKAIGLLVLCIALIIVVILYALFRNYTKDFNYLKEDMSEHLVYTRYKINKQEVPYVNIKSDSITSVNKNIVEFCNNFKEYDKIKLSYEYSINGNYLSLVIKVKTNHVNDWEDVYFMTYNIDLKQRSFIDEEHIKQKFKVTDELLNAKIHNQFVDYYNDEIEQGFLVEEECDYDCYIKNRGFEEYTQDLSFYIKDSKLIVFKPFDTESVYGEEEYFTDENFEIPITE